MIVPRADRVVCDTILYHRKLNEENFTPSATSFRGYDR